MKNNIYLPALALFPIGAALFAAGSFGETFSKRFLRRKKRYIFALILSLIIVSISIYGDVQGPLNPATAENDASIGDTAWVTPGNVFTSNDARATVGLVSSTSQYLKATNFSFTIPAGATIDGIKVEVERSIGAVGAGNIDDNSVKIVKGGTISGNEKATFTSWTTTDVYATYGGTSDLWGLTWTSADINAANFGVAISVIETAGDNKQARIDHIRITVYYTPNQKPLFYANSTNTSSPFTSQDIKFNINWTDETNLSMNFFETNISGSIKNFTTLLTSKSVKINITNKTSGSTGRFYWRSYVNDSIGNWNFTNKMFYNVSSTTSTSTTTVQPSSSGGSSGPRAVYDFSVFPDAIKVLLKPGDTLFRDVIVKNIGNRQLDIILDTTLDNFISLTDYSLLLKPGEEKAITAALSSALSTSPGIYSGTITLSAGRIIRKVLAVIEVKQLKPLFDIKVELVRNYSIPVYPGQEVEADIIMYNIGDLKPVDVNLFYSIRNLAGEDIAIKDETLAVNEQQQIRRSLVIPNDIQPGNYLFYGKIIYDNNAQASSSSLIKIIPAPVQQPARDYTIYIYSSITILLLILIILVSINLYRKRKPSRYDSYSSFLRKEMAIRLQQGYTKEQILMSAVRSGWPEALIKNVLGSL